MHIYLIDCSYGGLPYPITQFPGVLTPDCLIVPDFGLIETTTRSPSCSDPVTVCLVHTMIDNLSQE